LRWAPGRLRLVAATESRSAANFVTGSRIAFVSAEAIAGSTNRAFRIAAVRADGSVGSFLFTRDARSGEAALERDPGGSGNAARLAASPAAGDAAASPGRFATLPHGRVLVSCGHWDHSVRLCATEDGRELQIASGHRDLVTCVAAAVGGIGRRVWAKRDDSDDSGSVPALVVSGSRDTTCSVWEASPPFGGWNAVGSKLSFAKGGGLGLRPRRTLFGHDDAVTCVAASGELDLVVSGGADGAVLLHALRAGRHLRCVRRGRNQRDDAKRAGTGTGVDGLGIPSWVALLEARRASTARVLVYCGDALLLSCHGVNADCDEAPLARAFSSERVNALAVSPDERFLALGTERGSIALRATHDLKPWARLDGPGPPITALGVTSDDCFVAGLGDGRIAVWAAG
jgi:WD40 repeat protein